MAQASSRFVRPSMAVSLLLFAGCGRTDFPPSHAAGGNIVQATGGAVGSGGGPSSTGGRTVAPGTGGALPPGNAWPVFGRDPQGTRRSPVDTSKNKGTLKWSLQLGSDPLSSPVIDKDGTVFVYSTSPILFAVTGSTGEIAWSYGLPTPEMPLERYDRYAPALGDDHAVYISTREALYAINAPSQNREGSLRWIYRVPSRYDVIGPLTVGDDGTVIALGSSLYAFDGLKGILKWTGQAGSYGLEPPAIGKNGTAYYGMSALMAVVPPKAGTVGTLAWSFTDAHVGTSPAIGSDGTIYVGGEDLRVNAVSPGSGAAGPSLKWSYRTGSMGHAAPAIGSDGTVYVVGVDWYLFAFAPKPATADGELKWRWSPPADFSPSEAPAIGGDGTVYVAGKGGIRAITPPKGNGAPVEKWAFDTGESRVSPPAIGPDGTVYATDDGGMLYAIQ